MITIDLGSQEIAYFTQKPFNKLSAQVKRSVAARILRARNTPHDNHTAFMIETSNPNYQNFSVIQQ